LGLVKNLLFVMSDLKFPLSLGMFIASAKPSIISFLKGKAGQILVFRPSENGGQRASPCVQKLRVIVTKSELIDRAKGNPDSSLV